MTIPRDFPVRPLTEWGDPEAWNNAAASRTLSQCGTCGRSWDDSVTTSLTPAPSGRCPFEYFHRDQEHTQ